MCKKQNKVEIIIIYPRRPGFIMKAYQLQQQLVSQFGLCVLLEERIDDCFKVAFNGTTIYEKTTEDNSNIDHKKIISLIGR